MSRSVLWLFSVRSADGGGERCPARAPCRPVAGRRPRGADRPRRGAHRGRAGSEAVAGAQAQAGRASGRIRAGEHGEQDPALQLDALEQAGCWRVFTDHASGSREDRPELAAALESLRPGDTLVVWRLDRLGRSLQHLIDTVTALQERGVGFRSVTESIYTTTAGGRLVFHLFGALAEFERQLIRDRTLAGLAAARARGLPKSTVARNLAAAPSTTAGDPDTDQRSTR